ncbi:MAG TPA: helix-turn-helix transcriptional regulator, partial [Pilimelia sp.]|nr:helix-turn-helix transcriptional regulator [Pilimelia sp.]
MVVRPSPPAIRRQLGVELRRLREGVHRTVADVAAELGWSESKLSRIETAHSGVRPNDLGRLLTVYGVDKATRNRLGAMAGQARQRAWWEVYGDALPNAYEMYIGFEAEAVLLREFNLNVVPGLLQTDEYAHAVTRAGALADDPESVAQLLVQVRMSRRAVLTRVPPLELHAIIDEAVLRREVGGRGVMHRQLRALLDAAERPTVAIQILPFSAGAHPALISSFLLLDFAPGAGEQIVYCDGMTGGVFRERP